MGLDFEISTANKIKLEAKKVMCIGIEEYTPNDKEGKEQRAKVVLEVNHPDRDVAIKISKAKYEKDGVLKTAGMWITLGDDGKLVGTCALALVMKHYGLAKPKEFVGKDLETTTDEKGYLIIKAY